MRDCRKKKLNVLELTIKYERTRPVAGEFVSKKKTLGGSEKNRMEATSNCYKLRENTKVDP